MSETPKGKPISRAEAIQIARDIGEQVDRRGKPSPCCNDMGENGSDCDCACHDASYMEHLEAQIADLSKRLASMEKDRDLAQNNFDAADLELVTCSKRLAEQQESEAWLRNYFVSLNVCGRHDNDNADFDKGDKCIFCNVEELGGRLAEVEAALQQSSLEVIDWQSAAGKAEERLEEAEVLLRSWLEVEIGSTISIAVRKGSTAHYFETLESVNPETNK